MRTAFLFSLLIIAVGVSAQTTDIPPPIAPPMSFKKADTNGPFSSPRFKEGEDSLERFINAHNTFLSHAPQNGVKANVRIKCSVSETGILSDFRIIWKLSPEMDAEALRILKQLPPFLPARINGKDVKGFYEFLIPFIINH
jgi:hypothetical protein